MMHLDLSENPNHYAKGWVGVKPATAQEVGDLVVAYTNSPCLWAHGIRLKRNFRAAFWIGLDFDGGVSLASMTREFEPFIHVIGTTRNHGVLKNGVNGDRFRVFLKLTNPISQGDKYENIVRYFVKKYGADPNAVDCARLFFRCRELTSVNYSGKTIDPDSFKDWEEKIKKNKERKVKQYQVFYSECKALPGKAQIMIKNGCEWNTRHSSILWFAHVARSCGWSEDEVFAKILNSPIPRCGDKPFDEKKARAAVKDAYLYS